MKQTPRQITFEVLNQFQKSELGARDLLDQKISKAELSSRDAGLARELTLGIIREMRLLDHHISKFIKVPIEKNDPKLINAIRLGFYQHFFLERIPDHSLVDQSVEIAKRNVSLKGSKFVNAVLRNLLRTKPQLAQHLDAAIQHSHPNWLARILTDQYGKSDAEKFMQWNQQKPDLHLRITLTKNSPEEFINNFQINTSAGITPESLIVQDSIGALENLEWFKQGLASPQDCASQLVVHLLDPQPNEKIIDWCGAPGSKTCHIAELTNNQSQIFALDIDPKRVEKIKQGAERLNHQSIKAELITPELLEFLKSNPADKILVDAPCTGLGTLRRNPDIRWRRQPNDPKTTQKLQLEILNTAAKCLIKNGTLVYSVCTVTEEESEQVIEKFLKKNQNFKLDDAAQKDFLKSFMTPNGFIKTFPPLHNCDGFFAAPLIKTS